MSARQDRNYRHFFYGGAPGVAENLAQSLRNRHDITVAGTYTPPFRPLSQKRKRIVAAKVQASAPDVMWIGLSTPKQERWMYEHRDKFLVPAMLGVGAAFDFNCGKFGARPDGLEMLASNGSFDLVEPKRFWKRYLVTIPARRWSVWLELFHLKTFD